MKRGSSPVSHEEIESLRCKDFFIAFLSRFLGILCKFCTSKGYNPKFLNTKSAILKLNPAILNNFFLCLSVSTFVLSCFSEQFQLHRGFLIGLRIALFYRDLLIHVFLYLFLHRFLCHDFLNNFICKHKIIVSRI